MSNLNPQITTVEIGVKSLREVTLYPLSMADQFKMTDVIVEVFREFSELDEGASDVETVEKGISLIQKNLTKIFKFILDDDSKIEFEELTNDQFTDIVTIIYEVNYEGMLGKFKGLSEKVMKVFQSKKPLPISSDIAPASD